MYFIREKLSVFLILFSFLGFTQIVYATQIIKPQMIAIHNNIQANIKLSNTDINRLFVRGEKIISIDAPNRLLSAHNDASGSVYVNVYGHTPFSVFISTNEGLHFSLLVMPKAIPGKTILFKPVGFSPKSPLNLQSSIGRASHFEKKSPYQKLLVELIRQSMLSKIPPGYTVISPKAFSKAFPFKNTPKNVGLNQKITQGMLGGNLALRVIQVKNTRKIPRRLFANEFYAPGIRAVAIAQQYLVPHGKTFVYEVLSNA